MVGRTKPQKKMDSKVSSDLVHLEIAYLKDKNSELAKALAESKATLTQIVDERDILQRELFSSNLRCTKLENYIKMMQNFSRACMSAIVTASTHTTQLLETAHSAVNINSRSDDNHSEIPSVRVSPNTPNKTQAVKPMIGGHVILRPTINLRRVNEFSHEELQRLQSDTQLNNSGNSLEETAQNQYNPYVRLYRGSPPTDDQRESFANNEEAEYNGSASSGSDLTPEENGRLDTVQEEGDEDLQPTLMSNEHRLNSLTNRTGSSFNISGSNSQVPLLSGVFRDVRVYLSPIQNLEPHQNITKERGSNKRHKTQRSHSMGSTGAQEQEAESRNFNRSSLSPSVDDSYTALQNSLMSSSKVSTPNHLNLRQMKFNNLSWVNVANKYSSPTFNRFNGNSADSSQSSSKVLNSLNQTSTSSGSHTLVDAGDPLEGPSTLLDNNEVEIEDKIEVMNGLGLIPTFPTNMNSTPQKSEPCTPPTPSSAVVTRRRERLCRIEKKTMLLTSSKTPKVIVKRVSLAKAAQFVKRQSRSPIKSDDSKSSTSPKRSSDGARKGSRSPKNKSKRLEKTKVSSRGSLEKRKRSSSHSSLDQNSKDVNISSTSSTASTTAYVNEKPRRLMKVKVKANNSRSSNISDSSSPLRNRRPRRAAVNKNLKEPSLAKKLRRSK